MRSAVNSPKKRLWIGLISTCLAASSFAIAAPREQAPAKSAPQPSQTQSIRVLFSPDGGCTEAIVEQLGQAKRTLDVQAYSFTSAPIAKAVADAQARGVKVRAVLDKGQRSAKYTSATYLLHHDVPTFIDAKHAIAHNKIMIIDGQTIITGSFNFTKAAEQSNAENMLIIAGYPELVTEYQKNFDEHLGHAEKYTGPTPKKPATPDEQKD